MKQYLVGFAILFIVLTGNAEWALSVGDNCPEFSIYKYEDENYSSAEDIPGNVVIYAFGSIT